MTRKPEAQGGALRSLTCFAVAAVLSSVAVPARAQYIAIDLTPPGYTGGVITGLSSTLQAGYAITPGGLHAMLWYGTAASAVDVHPSGYASSVIRATSGSEHAGSATPSGGQSHAMKWSSDGTQFVDLHPAGWYSSQARGSAAPLQVGYGQTGAAPSTQRALLWSGSAESVVDLTPAGFTQPTVRAAFGDRQVGWGTAGNYHALMWSGSAESAVDLHPSGYRASEAFGIYDSQQVGDALPQDPLVALYRAMIWQGSADSAVEIHPAGYAGSTAFATNGTHQVGLAYVSAGVQHAMVWSGTAASAVDLNAFLPLGLVTSAAFCVNQDGVVGGAGYDATGTAHPVLWIPVSPSTTIAVPNAPGQIGQTTSLAATLTRASDGVPLSGETLRFILGGLVAGTTVTGADGTASLAYVVPEGVGPGPRTITVEHDASVAGAASSATGTLTVTQGSPSFSLYAATGGAGQTVSLRAILASGWTRIVGRTVGFAVDGTPVGTGTSDGDGVAACSFTIPGTLAPGPHDVTASFAGDACYLSASRTTTALTVRAPTVRPGFSLYASRGAIGQTVTLRSLMLSGGQPVLGRVVQFAVDGAPVGQGTSDASGVSVSYKIPASLAVGVHNVTVTFAGDAQYAPASRTTAALTVTKGVVGLSLYATKGSVGQTVTLRSLMLNGGQPIIGRTVQFLVDGVPVGTGVSDASGVSVSYTIPGALSPGVHNVTVTLDGDASFLPAARTAAALTVL